MQTHAAQVRPATNDDIAWIQARLVEFRGEHVRNDPDRFDTEADPVEAYAQWLPKLIAGEGGVVLVVEREGARVGYLLAEIYEECPRTWSARHAYLHDIFLDAAARGSGAGTLLLEALKSWARQRDIWQVRATTGIWNEPSRAFFLKRAFRPACVELLCQLDE